MNIIYSMLEEKSELRPTSKQIYERLIKEYTIKEIWPDIPDEYLVKNGYLIGNYKNIEVNYIKELDDKRVGRKIYREMIQTENMNIYVLCAWTHYVCNAMKVIQKVKEHFEEIILTEFIENNFLFKIKKTPESKSIGFLFGIVEKIKEECNITEYSIQPTSLEQIFNMFAASQGIVKTEDDDKNKQNDNLLDEKVEIDIDEQILNELIYE